MITEIDEIAKEIDMFRNNLLGLNGIIDCIQKTYEGIKNNTDLSNEQLAKIDDYSKELDRLSSEIQEGFTQTEKKYKTLKSRFNLLILLSFTTLIISLIAILI